MEPGPSEYRHRLLIIALLAGLVYMNSLHVPFQWDDIEFIADNPIIHDLGYFLHPSGAEGLRWHDAFVTRYVGYLSFALNYALHGAWAPGYHVFNIAVHMLNSLLVFWLVILLFRTPALSGSLLSEKREAVAMWSALIFAAHPVQTEAVTYVFQRHASLAALFWLSSACAYLLWRMGSGRKWYALALLSAVLAMKTKESAFALPLALAGMELVFFAGGRKKRVLLLLPFILTMAIVPLSLAGLGHPPGEVMAGLGEIAKGYAGLEGEGRAYLITEWRVVVTYLRLFFFTVNQDIDYDYPVYGSLSVAPLASLFLHLSLICIGVFLVIRGRGRSAGLKLAGFGLLWFYAALLVESSVIPIPMVINEYRMYLPLAGLALSLATMLFAFHSDSRVPAAALMVIVLVFSVLTVHRNSLWESGPLLWADTASKSPMKARPWYNLGVVTEAEGDRDRAIGFYEKAVGLDPGYIKARFGLGAALGLSGRHEEAAGQYSAILDMETESADALNNLGVSMERLGRMDEAARAYEESAALDPGGVEARLNLGALYLNEGDYASAIEMFREATALDETNVRAFEGLGLSYFRVGRLEDSAGAYLRAVEISPRNARALYSLGSVSLMLGRFKQAENHFRNALAIDSNYADAHMGLASALDSTGRHDEARGYYEAAVRAEPESPVAEFRLGLHLDGQGDQEGAMAHYLKAVELDPGYANALNNLGTIYDQRGDRNKAEEYFVRAIGADPSHADAHNNLGVVYYGKGLYREAYEEFRAAAGLKPENESFRKNLSEMKRVLNIR